jgi:hypothetical protein
MVPGTGYQVSTAVDPSLVTLDGFEGDVSIEVWIRTYYYAPTMLGAVLNLQGFPPGGAGAARTPVDAPYPQPFAGFGSSANWRIHRAGILRLPSEPGAGAWSVIAQVIPGAGSSGLFAWDYLLLVPARHRASSPTGVSPLAGGYPRLLASSGGAQTKTIRRDGSGQVSLIGGTSHSDTGLSGPLLVAPGPSGAVLVAASPAVPDDPGVSTGDVLTAAVPVRVTVTPRYSLLSVP